MSPLKRSGTSSLDDGRGVIEQSRRKQVEFDSPDLAKLGGSKFPDLGRIESGVEVTYDEHGERDHPGSGNRLYICRF